MANYVGTSPILSVPQIVWIVWCGMWSMFWMAMAFPTLGFTIPLVFLSNAASLIVMGPQIRAARG